MREAVEQSIGRRYGHVVVKSIRREEQNTYTKVLAICVCDCGNTKDILVRSLRSGRQKTCGCLMGKKYKETHGQAKKDKTTKIYVVWSGMHSRCYNTNASNFHCYGGRGINVCESWHSFANFYHDMGNAPKGMTLDRIDNSKGYSKENCRWANHKSQSRNRRTNRLITYNNETKLLTDWCILYGLNFSTVSLRLDRSNWDFHKAITQPVRRKNGQGRQNNCTG